MIPCRVQWPRPRRGKDEGCVKDRLSDAVAAPPARGGREILWELATGGTQFQLFRIVPLKSKNFSHFSDEPRLLSSRVFVAETPQEVARFRISEHGTRLNSEVTPVPARTDLLIGRSMFTREFPRTLSCGRSPCAPNAALKGAPRTATPPQAL